MPQHKIAQDISQNGYSNGHTTSIPVPHVARSHATALAPFLFARCTVACERHPARNEDSIVTHEHTGLAAVFDGVGGSAAGQVASQTAARATLEEWQHTLALSQKGRKIHTLLETNEASSLHAILKYLVQAADERVRTEGAQRAATDDLATTVAMVAICRVPETRAYTMVYAHVGDSRVYLLHGQEPIKRLTRDDGLLAKLVENQLVQEVDANRIDQAMCADQLSDTEFSYFRLRGGITQALGGPQSPTIHVAQTSVTPGDRILLCTDGIHDNLTDEEIEDVLRSSPRTTTARLLVERSLERSRQERGITIRAKPDDMSAIVISCRF